MRSPQHSQNRSLRNTECRSRGDFVRGGVSGWLCAAALYLCGLTPAAEPAIANLGREGIGQRSAVEADMMQKRNTGNEECSNNTYLKPELLEKI